MGRLTALLISVVCLINSSYAQKNSQKNQGKTTPLLPIALSALDSSINELQEIEDLSTRISIAEEIVRLLSKHRPDRCRQMLDSLFAEVLRQEQSSADSGHSNDPHALAQKIIGIAAKLDPKLAESYIKKYSAKWETDKYDDVAKTSPLAADLYLKFAMELIERDPVLAVSFGEKSLNSSISIPTLIFLEKLRQKNGALADEFLISALQAIAARGGNDINELLLLYSHVFSPLQIPVVRPDGLHTIESFDYRMIARDRATHPALARQYLQLSTQIITNPNRYINGVGHLSAGVAGDLFFVRLLTAQAQAYLPNLVEHLTTQQKLVANYLEPDVRASLHSSAEKLENSLSEMRQEKSSDSDTIEKLLEEAKETTDPQRRDQIYYDAALKAISGERYDQALDIADKLSFDIRDAARQLIIFGIAEKEVKRVRLESAERWAKRDGDLARRAFILNLIADSLLNEQSKNLRRASEILDEVHQITSKMNSDKDKISTLVGSASVYSRYDEARATEVLQEAIRVANKVESFKGDVRLTRIIEIGGFGYVYYLYYDNLRLEEVIRQLGKKNFLSIMADVQLLKNRIARLKAVIALCSTVIVEKQAASKASFSTGRY